MSTGSHPLCISLPLHPRSLATLAHIPTKVPTHAARDPAEAGLEGALRTAVRVLAFLVTRDVSHSLQ